MITHSEMVKKLVKDSKVLAACTGPREANLIHAVLGISGEAGELVDAIKKSWVYDKSIDRENIIEELGDLEFYMEQLRQELFITREETIEHNIMKLGRRYKDHIYSNEQAQERKDKQ